MILPSLQVLDEVIDACRAAQAAVSVAADPYREWFDELLAEHALKRLEDSECSLLAAIEVEGRMGLLATRKGLFVEAEAYFRNGYNLLEETCLGEEAYILAQSMLCAQRAYYHYRIGDDPAACALLELSFENDLMLEERHAYHVLHMHRVQLLHNLIRINARRGCCGDALRYAYAVLAYIEAPDRCDLQTLPPPWCYGWSGGFINHIPRAMTRAMHEQISAELASMVAEAATIDTQREEIASALGVIRTWPIGQADEWIRFQRALYVNEQEDPIAAAVPLLRRGPEPSAPLWRSASLRALELIVAAAASIA